MNLQTIEERVVKDNGLPADFVFYGFRVFPSVGEPLGTEMTGAQCPRLKSGKNKGKPNYKLKTNERTFAVTNQQCEQFENDYESETGNCRRCRGSGKTVASVCVTDGTTWRECSRCSGTGKRVETH